MDPGFLLGHTGSGGMTTSLAMGRFGAAADRRAANFPLTPIIHDGRGPRSTRTMPLLDTRYAHTLVTPAEMQQLVDEQWPSRSRPVNSRAQIDAMLATS